MKLNITYSESIPEWNEYIGYNLSFKQLAKYMGTLYKSDIISWSLSCQEMMWKHTPTLFSHFERKSACLRLASNRVLWKYNQTLDYKQIKIPSFCISCNISLLADVPNRLILVNPFNWKSYVIGHICLSVYIYDFKYMSSVITTLSHPQKITS